jgi:hypothetical protein
MGVPGFCGKPAAPPVQTTHDDPNADLIGYAFAGITVTGPVAGNPAYVAVDTPDGPSVRVAAQVRRRRELG